IARDPPTGTGQPCAWASDVSKSPPAVHAGEPGALVTCAATPEKRASACAPHQRDPVACTNPAARAIAAAAASASLPPSDQAEVREALAAPPGERGNPRWSLSARATTSSTQSTSGAK